MDPYENLANAIVLAAAEDYRKALRLLKRNPKHYESLRIKAECEKFFLSSWFSTLKSLDGECLLEKLKEEAEN